MDSLSCSPVLTACRPIGACIRTSPVPSEWRKSSFLPTGSGLLPRKQSHALGRCESAQVVQTRAGLPIISSVPVLGPVASFLLSPVMLLSIYVFGGVGCDQEEALMEVATKCGDQLLRTARYGASRFFSGFSRTTYSDAFATKFGLTIAWPVLFLASKAFRSNFKKAVR